MTRKRLRPVNPKAEQLPFDEFFREYKAVFKRAGVDFRKVPTKTGCMITTNVWPQYLSPPAPKDQYHYNVDEICEWLDKHGIDWKYTAPVVNKSNGLTRPGRLSVWYEGVVPDKDYKCGPVVNSVVHELLRILTWEENFEVGLRLGYNTKPTTRKVTIKAVVAIRKYKNRYELWFSSPYIHHKCSLTKFYQAIEQHVVLPPPESPFDRVNEQLGQARYTCVNVARDWCADREYKVEYGFKMWMGNRDTFVKGPDRPKIGTHEGSMPRNVTFAHLMLEHQDKPDPRYHAAIVVTLPKGN